MRYLLLASLLLSSCAPALLKVTVDPLAPTETGDRPLVHVVATFRGQGADRIKWEVCEFASSASVEPSDRIFVADFPCAYPNTPRVTLYRDGQEIASALGRQLLTGAR